jgi:hypothetical protein
LLNPFVAPACEWGLFSCAVFQTVVKYKLQLSVCSVVATCLVCIRQPFTSGNVLQGGNKFVICITKRLSALECFPGAIVLLGVGAAALDDDPQVASEMAALIEMFIEMEVFHESEFT